jgi:hypothetical protein
MKHVSHARLIRTAGLFLASCSLLATAACATAPRRTTGDSFEPACYESVGIYVVSRRHPPLPPELATNAVRLFRARGYTVEPANVTNAQVGGTTREVVQGSDSAVAAHGAARNVRGVFVITYISLATEPPVPELSGPIELRLGMLDVQQQRQVWTITNRGDGDEAAYLLQLLMDRVPQRMQPVGVQVPPSACASLP